MRILICLLLGSISLQIGTGRKYKRCEFLENLETNLNINRAEAVIWTCLAEKLTSIDTNVVIGTEEKYYGLFQINEKYWCSKNSSGCGMNCSALLDDDISDDLKCAQLIVNETKIISGNGFSAWPTYEGCRGQEETYLKSCNLEANTVDGSIELLKGGVLEDESPKPILEPEPKVYDQCDLARELYMTHGLPMDMVATMVCIANHESHFNSSAIGRRNTDGSFDYGMFQISDKFWCSPQEKFGGGCNLECNHLLDSDITDDVRCVKKIYQETSKFSETGFNAWAVYSRNGSDCKNGSHTYISDCFEESIMQSPGQMEPTQKAYEICELYEELKGQVEDEDIANFICIAYYESHLITSSTRTRGAHGIFQIKEDRWCRKKEDPADSIKGCPIYCDKLRDINIQDDIKCAKSVKALLGFEAWPAYEQFCKDRADVFTHACKAQSLNSVENTNISTKNQNNNPVTNSPNDDAYKPGSIAVNSVEEIPHSLSLPHYILSFTDPFQRLKATFEIEKSVLDGASLKIKPVQSTPSKKGGFNLVIEKDSPSNLLIDS